jgi:hypothetical protein
MKKLEQILHENLLLLESYNPFDDPKAGVLANYLNDKKEKMPWQEHENEVGVQHIERTHLGKEGWPATYIDHIYWGQYYVLTYDEFLKSEHLFLESGLWEKGEMDQVEKFQGYYIID